MADAIIGKAGRTLEELVGICDTLFYTGNKNPKNPVIFTPTAIEGMKNFRKESKGIEETFGKFYEFVALIASNYVGKIMIMKDYIMPKTFVKTDIANASDCNNYRDIHGNKPECVLGRNFVSLDNEFIDRAYAEAYCAGMEILGLDHTHPESLVPSPKDMLFVHRLGMPIPKPLPKKNRILMVQSQATGNRAAYLINPSYVGKVKPILEELTPKDKGVIQDLFPQMNETRDENEIKEILSIAYDNYNSISE
ncbi:MAG: hypothetical protein NTZ02_04155 [Candidatus Woesearchaeota archaeon]|nr:hypothetical protein [Candidatus Woesearchaeota archaeon]